MKTYYITIIGIIIIFFLCLHSCNDDKGNNDFEFHSINDVTINGLKKVNGEDTTFVAELGSTFGLTPTLEFKLGEKKSNFTYKWFKIENAESAKEGYELVSEEKSLSLPVEGTFSTLKTYKMLYRVTNEDTGIHYQKSFFIQVISRINAGYIALCEKENGFDIDMISLYKDTLTLYTEILDMMNSDLPRKGEKPMNIITYGDTYAPTVYERDGTNYTIIIKTDRATNKIKSGNFGYKPDYNIVSSIQPYSADFPGEVNPEKIIPFMNNTAGSQTRLYMYNNNNIYMYNTYGSLYLFSRAINKIRYIDNSRCNVAPYVAGSFARGVMLFDEDNKRFLYNALSNSASGFYNSEPVLSVIELKDDSSGPENSYFSFNENIEKLLYMDTYAYGNGFAIIKDSSLGKYRLIQFTTDNNKVSKTFGGTFENSALIESIKFFARNPAQPYLYMATEDKVYRMLIDPSTMNSIEDITKTCLTSGYKISTFKYLSHGANNFQNYLTIGSYNPSGEIGKNGKLEFYNSESGSGQLKLRKQPDEKPTANGYQIDMSFIGIGKPVDVAYKLK